MATALGKSDTLVTEIAPGAMSKPAAQERTMAMAMLPPGAFIGLGMMLAVKYLIDERSKQRKAKAAQADLIAPSDVTGKA